MAALPVLALLLLLAWGGPRAAGQKRKEVRGGPGLRAPDTGTGPRCAAAGSGGRRPALRWAGSEHRGG